MIYPPRPPSVSSASTFAEICERRAFLERLLPRVETEPLLRGKAVHEAIEQLLLGALVHRSSDPYNTTQYVERLIAWPSFSELSVVEVEQWFSEIPARPGLGDAFRWNGKIDLLNDGEHGLEVLDWKTISAARKIKTEREARGSLQLQVYCLVTGARRAGFVWLPPAPAPVSATIVDFTESELDRAWLWAYNHSRVIKARWGALADDCSDWEEVFAMAAPGHPLCSRRWCDHWNVCFDKERADMGTLKDALNTVGSYFTNDEFEKIGEATYSIRDLKTVSMGGRGGGDEKEDKPVLYFVETRKGLVLNKSRIGQLSAIFEDPDMEYKDCGKKVKLVFDPLFRVPGSNQKRAMICIEAAEAQQ